MLNSAFREGQEEMRDRAAAKVEENKLSREEILGGSHWTPVLPQVLAREIRSLPIE
jgi:hypothetical protein